MLCFIAFDIEKESCFIILKIRELIMVNISFQFMWNLFEKNFLNTSIKIWQILLFISILIFIIPVALIPLYLKKNNKSKN
jgi:hypothetical protein